MPQASRQRDCASPLRPRRRNPNLARISPTRPPLVAADVALWPSWSLLAVEDLDLDRFSDDGFPLDQERGN